MEEAGFSGVDVDGVNEHAADRAGLTSDQAGARARRAPTPPLDPDPWGQQCSADLAAVLSRRVAWS